MNDVSPPTPVIPRPARATLVATLLVLAAVAFGAATGLGGGGPSAAGAGAALEPVRALADPVGLVLDLVPSPELGPAPLAVNVTASIGGGTPPYALTVCFGTADHTSPTGSCQPTISNWSGSRPIVLTHVFSSVGNFSVLGLANDSAGESVGSTALVAVTNAAPLIVSAVEQTTAGSAPLSVSFNESVTGPSTTIALSWEFGDGTSLPGAPGVPVTHVYVSVGTYQPMLIVSDSAGHRSTQSLPPITVNPAHPLARSAVSGLGTTAEGELVAAFVGAAAVAAVTVASVRRRRWRREGNELVEWLRDSERSRTEPPRTP